MAAAGNAGNNAFHLGYNVTATEQFTWFKKLSYDNLAYFELWADSVDLADVNFRIQADDPSGFINLGTTPEYNILSDYTFAGGSIDSSDYVIAGAGDVKIYIEKQGNKYFLQFVIIPDEASYYWRFATSGAGYFDIWAVEGITGFSNYVTTGLPSAAEMPEIVNYKFPDTDQSIVSSWQ